MCFGGRSTPAPQQAPPPPPPPMDSPASPELNEADQNADTAASGSRRGRRSLRVDLNTNGQSTVKQNASGSYNTGLNVT